MNSLTNIYCIVVTYNGGKWVDYCFGSLRKSGVAVKIICIDNGSTDNTVSQISSKFPEVELIETGINLGFGQANNIGIRKALAANATYVFLLNQDAWVRENSIALLLEQAEINHDFGILSPVHLTTDGNNLEQQFKEFTSYPYTGALLADLYFNRMQPLYETNYIHAAAWFISITCIKKTGGFDPLYFHYGEDDDYLQRAKHFGFKVGIVTGAEIVHDSKYNSWELMEWNKNRNMIIAYKILKNMKAPFHSNFLYYFKTSIDEISSLLLFRKFKKCWFRFKIFCSVLKRTRKIRKSYYRSFQTDFLIENK